jgi:hypothetical protein
MPVESLRVQDSANRDALLEKTLISLWSLRWILLGNPSVILTETTDEMTGMAVEEVTTEVEMVVVATKAVSDLGEPRLGSPGTGSATDRTVLFSGAPRGPTTRPEPSNCLGVFGLSLRTREADLDDEFKRYGTVESVTIVYDQKVILIPILALSNNKQLIRSFLFSADRSIALLRIYSDGDRRGGHTLH